MEMSSQLWPRQRFAMCPLNRGAGHALDLVQTWQRSEKCLPPLRIKPLPSSSKPFSLMTGFCRFQIWVNVFVIFSQFRTRQVNTTLSVRFASTWDWGLRGFPQSLQENHGIALWYLHRPLPFTYLIIVSKRIRIQDFHEVFLIRAAFHILMLNKKEI